MATNIKAATAKRNNFTVTGMYNDSPILYINGKFDKRFLAALIAVAKTGSLYYILHSILFKEAFVYGYKAGTAGKTWTHERKYMIYEVVKDLSRLIDAVWKYNWEKGLPGNISKSDIETICRCAASNGYGYTHAEFIGVIEELVDISTIYKHTIMEAPNRVWDAQILTFGERLTKLYKVTAEIKQEQNEKANKEEEKKGKVKINAKKLSLIETGTYTITTNNNEIITALIKEYDETDNNLVGVDIKTGYKIEIAEEDIKEIYKVDIKHNFSLEYLLEYYVILIAGVLHEVVIYSFNQKTGRLIVKFYEDSENDYPIADIGAADIGAIYLMTERPAAAKELVK